jgi:hypothetical protein
MDSGKGPLTADAERKIFLQEEKYFSLVKRKKFCRYELHASRRCQAE